VSPAPIAILTGLTPGALAFSVRAWTTPRSDWVAVRSALSVGIRDGLAEAGIEVPLPQREMYLRHACPARWCRRQLRTASGTRAKGLARYRVHSTDLDPRR
jgi:small-conductance mechanosensitive channel